MLSGPTAPSPPAKPVPPATGQRTTAGIEQFDLQVVPKGSSVVSILNIREFAGRECLRVDDYGLRLLSALQ